MARQGYSEPALRAKLARYAAVAGREVVEKVLWLYYAARRPETPMWAKATVGAAIAYFILPADLVPDILPVVGYGDDLAALSAALATIARYVDDDVRRKASAQLVRWFGDRATDR